MEPLPRLLPRPAARKRAPHVAAERVQSIVVHLESLLNTRAGSSLLDPTYGLPDLTDRIHASSSRGASVAEQVAASVRAHEPRLVRVEVCDESASDDAPACLRFALTAALADDTPLSLQGTIAHGGQVILQRRAE